MPQAASTIGFGPSERMARAQAEQAGIESMDFGDLGRFPHETVIGKGPGWAWKPTMLTGHCLEDK